MKSSTSPENRSARLLGFTTLAKLALAILSFVLVAFIFEIGLRFAGFEAVYEIYSKPSSFWIADSMRGWKHAPGARGTYVGPRPWPIEFETDISINSLGLRGPEIEDAGPSTKKVLILGDSMVVAFEVPYEETFVSRVGDILSSKLGYEVSTINGGVRGYGTDQSYLYYMHEGRDLDASVVVLFHSRNDLRNNRTIHRMRRPFGKSAFRLVDGDLKLIGTPVPSYPACSQINVSLERGLVQRESWAGRHLCALQMKAFDRSALFSFITLRVPWNASFIRALYYFGVPSDGDFEAADSAKVDTAQLTRSLITALAHEVKSAGAEFLVIGLESDLDELNLERLEAKGINALKLVNLNGPENSDYHFKNDSHFNRIGHERVAGAIVPGIEQALLKLGPGKTASIRRAVDSSRRMGGINGS